MGWHVGRQCAYYGCALACGDCENERWSALRPLWGSLLSACLSRVIGWKFLVVMRLLLTLDCKDCDHKGHPVSGGAARPSPR